MMHFRFFTLAATLPALAFLSACALGSSAGPQAAQFTPSTSPGRSLPGTSGAPAQGVAGVGSPFTSRAFEVLRRAVAHPANYSTKNSLLYEADLSTYAVNIYETKQLASNPAPIASFNTLSGCPDGLAIDKAGTLYVADECSGNDIEEFPKGSTTEATAITGISDPSGLAIDGSGTLYVSTYPASIEEFKHGSTTPYQTITGQGLTDPFGLALDKSDNLYIADFGAHQVFEVAAGSTTVTSLGLQDLTEPLGVAVDDKTNDLWVTDGQGDKTNVYPIGSTSPSETISGNGFPYAASAQNQHAHSGTVVTSDTDANAVYAFESGSYTPYATLTNGVGKPLSILIAKP
jgi:sugar lactone lactonase YvrE